jgi:hypothetical protein
MSVHHTEPGELVVVDYGLNDGVAQTSGFCDLVRKELCPFIIGIGEVRTDVTVKGIVIFAANDRYNEDPARFGLPAVPTALLETESAPRRQISAFHHVVGPNICARTNCSDWLISGRIVGFRKKKTLFASSVFRPISTVVGVQARTRSCCGPVSQEPLSQHLGTGRVPLWF